MKKPVTQKRPRTAAMTSLFSCLQSPSPAPLTTLYSSPINIPSPLPSGSEDLFLGFLSQLPYGQTFSLLQTSVSQPSACCTSGKQTCLVTILLYYSHTSLLLVSFMVHMFFSHLFSVLYLYISASI